MKKHYIWGNIALDLKDWIDDIRDEYPDITEDKAYQIMLETNDEYFNDERMNLDIQLNNDIIIIADIGRWNGRFSGYKMIESGNIRDCLEFSKDCDYAEWHVDTYGNLRSTQHHHDGTHYLLYRAFKDDVTDEKKELLQSKIYNRTCKPSDISRYTYRLGDHIGDVYSWKFAGRKRLAV